MIVKSLALQAAAEKGQEMTEQRLQQYVAAGESLRAKLVESGAEMNRGNDIIAAQQADIRVLKDKLRVKNEVMKKQVCIFI